MNNAKDCFPKRLKEHRLKCELTQEELARHLMISPQSVSKWERGDGYPDINMLPKIAARLGVTTDILLGCDEERDTFDREVFYREYDSTEDEEDRIALALEWDQRYPDRDHILYYMCNAIRQLPRDRRKKYLPLLREKCTVIVENSTVQLYRDRAIRFMCACCEDDELERWLAMCPTDYDTFRGEVMEDRLWEMGDISRSRVRFDVNNLLIVLHILFRRNRNWNAPEKSEAWCLFRLNLLRFFGDGEVPVGWIPAAAKLSLGHAAALFGQGKREEGYESLARTFELYEKWDDIPHGSEVSLGCPALFGGMKIQKGSLHLFIPDADAEGGYTKEQLLELVSLVTAEVNLLYALTAVSGWEWFNSVRDEEEFKEYVTRAERMYGNTEE